ncbi:MAG: hypothetical protein WCO55_03075 [Candidatus Falkowbacteria bacterium]
MQIDTQKKLIIIVGSLVLLGIVGLFIFLTLRSNKSTPSTGQAVSIPGIGNLPIAGPGVTPIITTTTPTSFPQTITPGTTLIPGTTETIPGQGTTPRDNKIGSITQGNSAGQTLASSGGVQFYDRNDNKFYKISPDGTKTELSTKEFYNVGDVTWAPGKDEAVLYYPDGTKTIYNFTTDKQYTLPKHWYDLQFSPAGDALSFISYGANPDDTWFGIVNSDGTGAQAIEKLGQNADKAIVSWSPNNQIIGMFVDAVDFDRNQVFFIGKNGENFRSMMANGRGFQPLWSPSGQELLYSVYNSADNMRPQVWVTQASGDNIGNNLRPLNVETFASKCTYLSEQEVICGVPTSLPDGAGLVPALADETTDNIYLINTITGSKIALDMSGRFNVASPMYSTSEHALYFFNNLDGTSHRIDIPQR